MKHTIFIAVGMDGEADTNTAVKKVIEWLQKGKDRGEIKGYTVYGRTPLSFCDVKKDVLNFLNKYFRQ